MGVMKGDVVGEGDVVVGGDTVRRIVETRHLGWSVFVGGETSWEERGHKRRHHWRGGLLLEAKCEWVAAMVVQKTVCGLHCHREGVRIRSSNLIGKNGE